MTLNEYIQKLRTLENTYGKDIPVVKLKSGSGGENISYPPLNPYFLKKHKAFGPEKDCIVVAWSC